MWRQKVGAFVRKPSTLVAAASATSLASGLVVGHLLTKRQMTLRFDELMEKEIAETKAFYGQVHKFGEFSDPVKMAEGYPPEIGLVKAAEAFVEYQPGFISDESDPAPTETRNIFDRMGDNFDYEVEVSKRGTVDPYIITAEEFYQNEHDYVQKELTYFAADMILSDDTDQPVEEVDAVVGLPHLERFGAGSQDPNRVYIRNPRIEMDMEVVRSTGSFAEEVHGIIKHDGHEFRGKARRRRAFDE